MSKIVLTDEAVAPATPSAGTVVIYTAAGILQVLNSSGTPSVPITAGVMTTDGDMIYRDGAGAVARLGGATAGDLLVATTVGADTLPVWTSVLTANGDILVRTGGVPSRLGVGTNGQVLTVTAGAPAWTTATYPATVAAGDLVAATGANVVGVVAGPGATASILKHTGSGGTNLPAHISLAALGVDANKYVRANAAGTDFALATGDALVMGNGSDGAAHFTVAGPAPLGAAGAGTPYTLARNVNYTTVVVDAGVVVDCDGFFLRANVSITNEGIIHANGADGAAAGAGGGAGGVAGTVGSYRSGVAGGNGNNAGAGTAGTDVTAAALGAAGGAGGAGGNDGGANGGGAGGAVTAPTAVMGDWKNAFDALHANLPGYNAGTVAYPQGGAGGGGGGSGLTNVGTTSNGGGGGAGGGILKIAAPFINNTGGVISANGGAGGAGGAGTAGNDDGGGGGGGGGGGYIVLFCTGYEGNIPQVLGGTAGGGGAKMGGGAGSNGAVGTAGTAGSYIRFML